MVKQVRDEFEKAEKYLGSHQTKINYCKQKIEEETEKQRNAKLEKVSINLNFIFKDFKDFQPVAKRNKKVLLRLYFVQNFASIFHFA